MQRSYLQAFGQHPLCFLPLVDEEILMNSAKSGQIVPALGKGTDIEDRRGPSGRTRNSKGPHWQSFRECTLWGDIEGCRVLEWYRNVHNVAGDSRI